MKEERCENGHLIFSDEPGCPVCMPTQPANEWQNIVDSWIFDFSDDGKASMKTGQNTYVPYPNDFIKAFISSILLKQKSSLKQRDTKWKDAHAKYVADTLDGIKPEEAYRELLSALNEID